MSKYSEMSRGELAEEMDAWWRIITALKGPGTPSGLAREGAERLFNEAAAWAARRRQEST